MLSLSVGPLALPLVPVVLLGANALAAWFAERRSGEPVAGRYLWQAFWVGLVMARLGHLLRHAPEYLSRLDTTPWAALDLRDGGWWLPAGVAGGVAWLFGLAWRTPALRQALASGAAVGLLAAGLVAWAGGVFDRPVWPDAPLHALVDGRSLTLADAAQGRPAVVNVWASWCGPCRQEMPDLAAAQQRETRVAFVFVNLSENEDTVRSFLAGRRLDLRNVLLDPHGVITRAVGSAGVPTTLFYDARGRLVDTHVGVLNAAALDGRVRDLLQVAASP